MRFQLLLAWRYLRGRTLRNILTALAIFFGVWLIFTMRTFQPVMEESLRASIKAETEKGDLVISKKNGQLFSADLAKKIAATDGIAGATAILERPMYLSEKQIIKTKDGLFWDSYGDKVNLDWILNPIIRSAADLMVSEELKKIKKCADPICGWLFLDISRNRSRRWCDMKDCGNRAKASRFYQKKQLSKRESIWKT